MRERSSRFDNAKLLLMVMVVSQHAFITYVDGPAMGREAVRFVLLGCTMPLFMFIMGFFTREGFNLRRSVRLFWLFAAFNTVGNLVAWLFGFSHRFGLFAVAPVMWYLGVAALYGIFSPVCCRMPAFILLPVAFAMSWAPCFLPVGFASNFWGRFFGFIPFFILGFCVGRNKSVKSYLSYVLCNYSGGGVVLLVVCVAGVAFALSGIRPGLLNVGVSHNVFGGDLNGMVKRMVFQFLAILMGGSLMAVMPSRELAITRFGSRTFVVYLCHIWIVLFAAAVARHFPALHPWYARYAVMAISVLMSLLLFHKRASEALEWFAVLPERAFRVIWK